MSADSALGLFEGYGIEIEYMIVDRQSLAVEPIADQLLRSVSGAYDTEIELGDLAWSNELALHVIELKTNGPRATLLDLGEIFQADVVRINGLLEPFEAMLLPSGMHPWMNPSRDFRLWPHEHNAVYEAFDRIFGCASHGWVNLQSMHVNLPFANDREFGQLHAAIRLVLPIIPALAASTPAVGGELTGYADSRLKFYAGNSTRVPAITGAVIPEPIFSIDEYERYLLGRIYADLAPLDPDGVLRHEWVNARGAIARFDRMALEIRIIDTQECPVADVAVAGAVSAAVRALVEGVWSGTRQQRSWDHRELAETFWAVCEAGDLAVIDDARLLRCFGYPEAGRARCAELWQHIVESALPADALSERSRAALGVILHQGCLARRIETAVRGDTLRGVYVQLADCLQSGQPFEVH